jgi:succinate-acetate transporter protein
MKGFGKVLAKTLLAQSGVIVACVFAWGAVTILNAGADEYGAGWIYGSIGAFWTAVIVALSVDRWKAQERREKRRHAQFMAEIDRTYADHF